MSVREGGDNGIPVTVAHPESESAKALVKISQQIAAKVSIMALA